MNPPQAKACVNTVAPNAPVLESKATSDHVMARRLRGGEPRKQRFAVGHEPDLRAAIGFAYKVSERLARRNAGRNIAQQRDAEAVVHELLQHLAEEPRLQ